MGSTTTLKAAINIEVGLCRSECVDSASNETRIASFSLLHTRCSVTLLHLTSHLCPKNRVVEDLTTCHTQYTWDRYICIFLFNRTTLQVFVTYLAGALYVHPLWFCKHQHDNRVRPKLFLACQRWWFQWRFWFVPSVPGYVGEEEEHKPDLVRNCCWTVVTDRHSWTVSTQNAFSLPFAASLVNCAPSGEMHDYCTPHIIKENFENFLIHRRNYILLFQVHCVWQLVKTPTVILVTLYLTALLNEG